MMESPGTLSIVIIATGIFLSFAIFTGSRTISSALRRRSANSALELYVSVRGSQANGEVAEIYAKIRDGEALSKVDEARRRLAFQQQLNLYDLLYMHYRDGQIDEAIWQGIEYRIHKFLEDEWSRSQWGEGIKNSVSSELISLIESEQRRDS
jgi:hypothetical protein